MNNLNSTVPATEPPPRSINCEGPEQDCVDGASACSESPSQIAMPEERIDGAGEPCPAPLMWQEVREQYLRDSTPWEIVRGPHRLAGRTWGNGPPLYFLNHFAATAELYSLVIWLLRDQFRCVVYDAVTSDRRAARMTMPTMTEFADDLFLIAERHGDECFPIFGAGFGAAVALQATIMHPERDRVAGTPALLCEPQLDIFRANIGGRMSSLRTITRSTAAATALSSRKPSPLVSAI